VLTRQEWTLLKALVSEAGRVFRREDLIRRAWGPDVHITPRTVDVHVARLRRKIHAASGSTWSIKTVWGIGYRLLVKKTPLEVNPAPATCNRPEPT